MKRLVFAIFVGAAACSGNEADQAAALRANIGKAACNQTNGAYRGQIVDVTLYSAAGQSPELVYVVERDGRRQNAPVANTTVAERCGDGKPVAAGSETSAAAGSQTKASTAPQVDHRFAGTAAEFSKRLGAYQGALLELRVASGTITAKWTSQRCDMAEGEVIDLLLSLNRGHPAAVNENIEAERTCNGAVRRFSTTGSRFQQYRTGKINDPEILRGLK